MNLPIPSVSIEKETAKSRASIMFSSRIKVKVVPYSNDDIARSWYSGDEIKNIKQENTATLLYLKMIGKRKNMNNVDSERFCFRGLEVKTTHGAAQRLRRKHLSTAAVFYEQRRQRESGKEAFDPTLIANAYAQFTVKSTRDAQKMGLQDQKAAISILQSRTAASICSSSPGSSVKKVVVDPMRSMLNPARDQCVQFTCKAA